MTQYQLDHNEHSHADVCPDCPPNGLGIDDRTPLHRPFSRRLLIGGGLAAGAALPLLSKVSLGGAAPATRSRFTTRDGWPAPWVISRAEWGANESLRIGKPGADFDSTIKKLVVHHTATPNNPADPKATIRSIYQYHLSTEYLDIAYQYLIDQHGNIYEGRWSKDLAPGERPNGEDRQGRQVRGAHSTNTNTQTIGIALIGTFTNAVGPSPAAIESLVTLLAWKCARWGIDPLGAGQYLDGRTFPNISGHRDTSSSACPGDSLHAALPEIRNRVAARFRESKNGYWIAMRDGSIHAFGDVADLGDPRRTLFPINAQAIAAKPTDVGTWVLGADGGIFTQGSAAFYGSTGGMRLNQPIVGMATTPSGQGYWLVATDGGIFTFGDAQFFGSTGAIRLNKPIVGMTSTPTGQGYWLVASDGGIFTFGDARFFGSTGDIRLNQPIVGMASTPSGQGYWLVASDGGVFCFGDASFYGSTGGIRLNQPIVDLATTPTGGGYWMLARDGGVFCFGDAPFHGSAAHTGGEAVGIAPRIVV